MQMHYEDVVLERGDHAIMLESRGILEVIVVFKTKGPVGLLGVPQNYKEVCSHFLTQAAKRSLPAKQVNSMVILIE